MDAQLKAKWVEALRGGNYPQEYGKLVSSDGTAFCCLGVACKVGTGKFPHGGVGEVSAAQIVAESLGISPTKRDVLIRMNDFEKRTFSEIADYIEANL